MKLTPVFVRGNLIIFPFLSFSMSSTSEMLSELFALQSSVFVLGKQLFPASGYLYMVWETFCIMQGIPLNASRVSLRNCKFLRATSVPSKDSLIFTVSIQLGTGNFEVLEDNSIVATGSIGFLPDSEVNVWSFISPNLMESHGLWMDKKDVYKELRLRGYHYR